MFAILLGLQRRCLITAASLLYYSTVRTQWPLLHRETWNICSKVPTYECVVCSAPVAIGTTSVAVNIYARSRN